MDAARRKQDNDTVMMADLEAVEECFVGPTNMPNWIEVKKFVSAPVRGEGQLGRTLTDVEDATRGDNEKEFWKMALIGIRMMRRQASPMGSDVFGQKEA